MPLVRISLMQGKSDEFRRSVGDLVHQAMVETINCPPLDRFQIITEYSKQNLIYDPNYLDISRTDNIVIIQITLNEGRTVELKKALYKKIAELLLKNLQIRPEDIFINLVEVKKENWSFGKGIASYA